MLANYSANDPYEHNKKLLEKFLNIQYDSFQHFTDPTASQLFLILTRKCVFLWLIREYSTWSISTAIA